MASVWVTDVSDNIGRTYTGYERGGKIEALRWGILTWTTGIVWGGGVPAIQWVWDKTIPALTRHLEANPNSWLKWLHPANGVRYSGLDESRFQLEHADPHELLTQQRIDNYTRTQLKHVEQLHGDKITDALKAQAKADITAIAEHASQLAHNNGKNALTAKYSSNAIKRTLVSGAVPAILVGVVLPLIIQVLQQIGRAHV